MKKLCPLLLSVLCLYSCAETDSTTTSVQQPVEATADTADSEKQTAQTAAESYALLKQQTDSLLRSEKTMPVPTLDQPAQVRVNKRNNKTLVSYTSKSAVEGSVADNASLSQIEQTTETVKKVGSKKELIAAITPAFQQRVIDPSIDNIISGEKGVKIFIPANTLVFEDGRQAAEQVTISLQEFLTPADFLSRQLSSQSHDRLLETGGMINITATASGKSVEIRSGKTIAIGFPTSKKSPGMTTFVGDSLPGARFTWQPSPDTAMRFLDKSLFEDDSLYVKRLNVCENHFAFTGSRNRGAPVFMLEYFASLENQARRYYSTFPDSTRENICLSNETLSLRFTISASGRISIAKRSSWSFSDFDSVKKFFREVPFNASKADLRKLKRMRYDLRICCNPTLNEDEYIEKITQKFTGWDDRSLSDAERNDVLFYTLISTKLNWINCDKFYEQTSSLTDFYVDIENNVEDAAVMLVFSELNSVLQGEKTGGGNKMVFKNVPLGKAVKIVAIGNRNNSAVTSSHVT
ncbi:MAG: hypothetical protein J7527_13690, partial [Chitinophagaceae bacterium]|nr:hypothetical protein [Chitinophagaceae bacterium]